MGKSKSRTVSLPPELVEALKKQADDFKAKFGREPGDGDPLFWDPDEDTPTPLTPERFYEIAKQDLTEEEYGLFLNIFPEDGV